MSIQRQSGSHVWVSTLSGQWAVCMNDGAWQVSWLEGEWSRRQAYAALIIAETVASAPPLGDKSWLLVESLLAELGLDVSVLSRLSSRKEDES